MWPLTWKHTVMVFRWTAKAVGYPLDALMKTWGRISRFTFVSAMVSAVGSSIISGGQLEGSRSQVGLLSFLPWFLLWVLVLYQVVNLKDHEAKSDHVSIHCISSSTTRVGRIIFRWDMIPLDLVVLLDLVDSVWNQLSILPLTLDQ